jgi:hypothetical protein
MKMIGIILLALISFSSLGQSIAVGLEAGYGFYDMYSLRKMEALPTGSAIPYAHLQDFPATLFVRASGRVQIAKRLYTGITLGYLRTGSRSAYSDYSGNTHRDVVVNGFQLGCSNSIVTYSLGNYALNTRLSVGALFNSIKFERSVHLTAAVYDDVQTSEFRSVNPYFNLGGSISRKIGSFTLGVFAEYEFNDPGKVKLDSANAGAAATDFTVDWGGARLGLACSFQLIKKDS